MSSYEIRFVRSDQPGFHYQDDQVSVSAHGLSHRIPSYAYRFVEKTQSTQLNQALLVKYGVPRGELWGQLQQGKAVTLEDGQIVQPDRVKLPAPSPRIAVIGGDNDQPGLLLEALKGAHILVHEATMTQEVWDKGGSVWMHSSAKMVAEAAEQSGVPNLVLTHFSGRYRLSPDAGDASVEVLREEARGYYSGHIALAEDLKSWVLNREGDFTAQ